MFDHLGLRTLDLARSTNFYTAALAPLGHAVVSQDDTTVGIGPDDQPGLWLHAVSGGGGKIHLAFRASSRPAVDDFHAAALGAGGRDNGAPGPRIDYGPSYYAAFVLDPDGNNVEAVCVA